MSTHKSFVSVDFNSHNNSGPKWHVMKRYLMSALNSGQYKPGDVLPSEIHLSKTVGLARNTVRQALAELEKEGLVRRVKGSGTYITEQKEKSARKSLEAYGLILPEFRRSLFPSLVTGFEYKAGLNHHQVMICSTEYDTRKQGDIILQMIDKQMDGIAIVTPTITPTPPHQIRQLQSNGIPVVFCHRRISDTLAPLLSWDWQEVGRKIGQLLLSKGHHEIMYYGVCHYELTEGYEKGLRQILEAHGLPLPEHRVIYGPEAKSQDREGMDEIKDEVIRHILRGEDRPTAIFCSDDNEAERVYWLAIQEGLRVPEDLTLIGFGNTLRDTFFRKQLASVTVNEHDLGAKAAELLDEMRLGQQSIHYDKTFNMELSFYPGQTFGSSPR